MTIRIWADQMRCGDLVSHHGQSHRIAKVEKHDGWAWPVASDGTGWAIALDHQMITVRRD
jgi:hypothetical protein